MNNKKSIYSIEDRLDELDRHEYYFQILVKEVINSLSVFANKTRDKEKEELVLTDATTEDFRLTHYGFITDKDGNVINDFEIPGQKIYKSNPKKGDKK